jgi:hypothetical protein
MKLIREVKEPEHLIGIERGHRTASYRISVGNEAQVQIPCKASGYEGRTQTEFACRDDDAVGLRYLPDACGFRLMLI